jgi:hypothetical protein
MGAQTIYISMGLFGTTTQILPSTLPSSPSMDSCGKVNTTFASSTTRRRRGGPTRRGKWKYGVGIGDFCYTVGLFRVLSGNKQNLPVVHFGTIARPIYGPDEEPIPIKDWRDPDGKKTIQANAYLIESQSLSGLSGAPVFVRVSNHHVRDELIEHNPHAAKATGATRPRIAKRVMGNLPILIPPIRLQKTSRTLRLRTMN